MSGKTAKDIVSHVLPSIYDQFVRGFSGAAQPPLHKCTDVYRAYLLCYEILYMARKLDD
jgi:hypothetical protein